MTAGDQAVAMAAGREGNAARHTFLVITVVMLLLIAAPPGQAVIGAERTLPDSAQVATPVEAVATQEADKAATVTQEADKAATETPRAKGPDPKWQPPPMPSPAPFATVNISPEKARELAEKWGVELLGMRLTSAGYMLDFRFRVMDADKALPLFDHRIKPHIVAERSNIKLPVPMAAKVGAFRPTNRGKNIKADKTYYMIFGNPDRHVKVGEKVTVVIGDFKVEHLMVN
jgi:hypothetical protein